MENFFDFVIIFAPIIGYIPQVYKVIKKKTDKGFNTLRVSFLFNATILEFYLNLAYNLKNNSVTFHHFARTISLLIAFIGIIIKIIVKTIYSHNPIEMKYHNIINTTLFFVYSCIFLPIILLTNSNIILVLAILSSFMNFCNYIPQIYNTIKLRQSGSLSYLAVLFDYIGNIGIIAYLISNNDLEDKVKQFNILIPSIISNISIIIQLMVMYYYDYCSKKKNYNIMIELPTIKRKELLELDV